VLIFRKNIEMLITLTQGKFATIDAEDWGLVKEHKWRICKGHNVFYAITHTRNPDGSPATMYLHRLIMGFPDSPIDHINGDGLNNRKKNLRLCTCRQNLRNQRSVRGTSKYKGIYWNKQNKRWHASIGVDGQVKYLGIFVNEIEGAEAYDKAAAELFGKFACLNFPR